MDYQILTSLRSELAEGPIYLEEEDSVYWTDIEGGLIHRYDLGSNTVRTVHNGSKVGGMTVQEDGSLLLFRASGAIHHFRNGGCEVLVRELPNERDSRFNDVAADPAGRVFCGTMSTDSQKGRLYCLDVDGSITVVLENVGCSNGIGWSPDLSRMYFTDSPEGIFAFDYDVTSGEMTNRKMFFSSQDSGGVCDGMTVDSDGNLWVAVWGGGVLLKVDKEGQIMERLELPAQNITCPAFGGKDLDELFVTAAGGLTPEHGQGAGELMKLRPGVKGKSEFRSRIDIDALRAKQ